MLQNITTAQLEAMSLTHEVQHFLLPVSGIEGFIAVPLVRLLSNAETIELYQSVQDLLSLPAGEDNNYKVTDTKLTGWGKAYLGLKNYYLSSLDEKDLTAIFSTVLNFRESVGRPPKSFAYAQSVHCS